VLAQVVGVVNETAENIFALFVEGSNVGDAVNTAWDIIWHLVGALVAVIWMSRRGIPGTAFGRARRLDLESEIS
jgi:hypothetical protein